jgi:hypothetical protein
MDNALYFDLVSGCIRITHDGHEYITEEIPKHLHALVIQNGATWYPPDEKGTVSVNIGDLRFAALLKPLW